MLELGESYFKEAISHTIVTFRIRPGHYEPIETGLLHRDQRSNQPQTHAE
jgi:hypothetical protein